MIWKKKKSMESKSTKATKIMIELYGEGIRSLMMDSYIQKMNRNEETWNNRLFLNKDQCIVVPF